jgi:hypothetical protein
MASHNKRPKNKRRLSSKESRVDYQVWREDKAKQRRKEFELSEMNCA